MWVDAIQEGILQSPGSSVNDRLFSLVLLGCGPPLTLEVRSWNWLSFSRGILSLRLVPVGPDNTNHVWKPARPMYLYHHCTENITWEKECSKHLQIKKNKHKPPDGVKETPSSRNWGLTFHGHLLYSHTLSISEMQIVAFHL